MCWIMCHLVVNVCCQGFCWGTFQRSISPIWTWGRWLKVIEINFCFFFLSQLLTSRCITFSGRFQPSVPDCFNDCVFVLHRSSHVAAGSWSSGETKSCWGHGTVPLKHTHTHTDIQQYTHISCSFPISFSPGQYFDLCFYMNISTFECDWICK